MFIQGNTPFEIAERRRQEGTFILETAIATQRLVDHIKECDAQINYFIGLAAIGAVTKDERELAQIARKDKQTYEAGLEAIIKLTQDLIKVEA